MITFEKKIKSLRIFHQLVFYLFYNPSVYPVYLHYNEAVYMCVCMLSIQIHTV